MLGHSPVPTGGPYIYNKPRGLSSVERPMWRWLRSDVTLLLRGQASPLYFSESMWTPPFSNHRVCLWEFAPKYSLALYCIDWAYNVGTPGSGRV